MALRRSLSDEAWMENENSDFVRAGTFEELRAEGRLVLHGRHRPSPPRGMPMAGQDAVLDAASNLKGIAREDSFLHLDQNAARPLARDQGCARPQAENERAVSVSLTDRARGLRRKGNGTPTVETQQRAARHSEGDDCPRHPAARDLRGDRRQRADAGEEIQD